MRLMMGIAAGVFFGNVLSALFWGILERIGVYW
jgi:hypothetical protein